jgi:hypothetical protein
VFLNPDQLAELTGLRQSAAQLRWLRKNGITHYVRADGRPIVVRSAIESSSNTFISSSNTLGPDFDALLR